MPPEDKDKKRLRSYAWRKNNLEKSRMINKKWDDSNRDKTRGYVKKYSKTEKGIACAKKNRSQTMTSLRSRLKNKYGITIEEYDQIVIRQNGMCASCSEPGDLVIDHNHTTGVVRGLLCRWCNLALGHVKEDINRLNGLLNYLNKQEKKEHVHA